MRKQYLAGGFALITFLVALLSFGQSPTETPRPSPADTPRPSPSEAPSSTPMLISTSTPAPTPTPTATISPSDVGTVSVPSTLSSPLSGSPSPSATPISVQAAELGPSDLGWSESRSPTFSIDQAVILALQQNPVIRNALEEIRRTKGVIIQITAEALPQIGPNFTWGWTDPNLRENSSFTTFGSSPTPPPGGTPFPGIGGIKNLRSDIVYNVRVEGSQLIFNYSTFRSIRGTFFQRDSAYFALRNTVDTVIATVKTQFYQVVVNRELIVVQEESVRLLESQLKDQQNRFEAGTVPRFNVLQAEVALANQQPALITARNNYRIAEITLGRTIGLDFNPARGIAAPLRVSGDLVYISRKIDLLAAIEEG